VKKLLSALMMGLLLLGIASFAMADVDVQTDVDKEWSADVDVDANISKNVLLSVKQVAQVDVSAGAAVTKNSNLEDVDVSLDGTSAEAHLSGDDFGKTSGLISINQAPGFANNQGNASAISYAVVVEPGLDAFLDATTHMEQSIGAGVDVEVLDNPVQLLDVINDAAFKDATGVLNINQAAGNANNQDNAVALAIGTEPTASLAEADLGMEISGTNVTAHISAALDQISLAAFHTGAGALSINQASGSANNQGNIIAVTIGPVMGPF